jgi:outer membrane protein OmpA-like peptidoglycan-associated protein
MKTAPFVLATLVATLAACSSVPDRNLALDQARSRYTAAQNDAAVTLHAAEELKRAAAALGAADRAQAAKEDRAEIDHLAYLASQRVTIAQETAASRAAQAVTAGAAAERDRMRLSMRTAEADEAQRKLQASQQEGARKSADLAQADRNAQDQRAAAAAAAATSAAQVDSLEMQLKALNARKTERGIVVTLGDMLFDTGRSDLQAAGARNIQQLADFLKRQPQRQAAIEGYTDNVGSEVSNQSLSDRRANSVMAALVSMGVPAARLSARGNGEASPVADNSSAAGRQMNRRVEVIFAAEAGDTLVK